MLLMKITPPLYKTSKPALKGGEGQTPAPYCLTFWAFFRLCTSLPDQLKTHFKPQNASALPRLIATPSESNLSGSRSQYSPNVAISRPQDAHL